MAKKMYLKKEGGKARLVFETAAEIAIVAAIGLFLAKFIFFTLKTESRSMEPVIRPESVVFVNCAAYTYEVPRRFDVVAFYRKPQDPKSDILVRRIIGLPGETVRIERGTVYINGAALDLGGHVSEITSDGVASEAIRLGDDEYFVLGDTPANSEDSRSSTLGNIRFAALIGRAWMNAESITEIRLIKRGF